MRIAIVDDSPVDRVQLLECLTKYFAETKTEYETTCYEDAKDFLENYHYTFDFIILDIDMPGLSGINAAKILREKDPNVTLMFVTKMPQYAIEAYSVEAMDYMLKPVSGFLSENEKSRALHPAQFRCPNPPSDNRGQTDAKRFTDPLCGVPPALSLLSHQKRMS